MEVISSRPTFASTLSYLLLPVRLMAMALSPIQPLLSPLLWHVVNAFMLALISAVIVYSAVNYVKRILFGAVTPTANGVSSALLLPIRAIATPTCLVANFLCPLSLLGGTNETAQPFWRLIKPGEDIDVAAVSRELSKEVRNAKDIFESLQALGDGRMTEGLGHVR